ncbi:MAG TPA: hypothetical protein VGJ52_12090 [Vicinamibacterales bacterium]
MFGIASDVAHAVLDDLHRASVLRGSDRGTYSLEAEPSSEYNGSKESNGASTVFSGNGEMPVNTALRNASADRLACLFCHSTWANEAMVRFEQELTDGWDYDEDPVADHPFGAYYYWCALLCGFSEAALEHRLLRTVQLDGIRRDLEASLPELRACRQLLVVIPSSLAGQPRVIDLLRAEEMLGRLRRIHQAFGEAPRKERISREIDSLDH